MRELAENLYATAVDSTFGEEGPRALRRLMDSLAQLYRICDPAERVSPIGVFVRADVNRPRITAASPPRHELARINSVLHELDGACLVEITSSGAIRIYDVLAYDLKALSAEAIVYRYENQVEHFFIGGKSYRLVNPAENFASIFVRPTFSTLEAALERYRTRVAPDSSCFVLDGAWFDTKRLFLKAKPEALIRRSIHQHLRTSFSDAEIRPEQNVDETHPVDIKVTWIDANRRALIEVKWLGQSKYDDGSFATGYSEGRAREGAEQLADYLNKNQTAAPGLSTKGYLVVFDARRRGLKLTSTSVDQDDGLYYRDKDIRYDPEFEKARKDFAPPVRLFSNPILN
jgi:hypothetical protein